MLVGHVVPARRALEIAARILALHRDLGERRLACHLEHGSQQDRVPCERPADALLERIGELARDVTVRRRELEVEVDGRRGAHAGGLSPWLSPGAPVSTI